VASYNCALGNRARAQLHSPPFWLSFLLLVLPTLSNFLALKPKKWPSVFIKSLSKIAILNQPITVPATRQSNRVSKTTTATKMSNATTPAAQSAKKRKVKTAKDRAALTGEAKKQWYYNMSTQDPAIPHPSDLNPHTQGPAFHDHLYRIRTGYKANGLASYLSSILCLSPMPPKRRAGNPPPRTLFLFKPGLTSSRRLKRSVLCESVPLPARPELG